MNSFGLNLTIANGSNIMENTLFCMFVFLYIFMNILGLLTLKFYGIKLFSNLNALHFDV